MAKEPKSSAAAFRSLEAELAVLGRDEHQNKEAAAKAEACIKNICQLAYPDDPGFREGFIRLLRSRFRSSGAFIEYAQGRDRLLVRLGEIAADKHRRTLEESKRARADFIVNRDKQIAEEFLRKKDSSNLSPSDLKAEIGWERHRLKRSASIAAAGRGLKPTKPRKA